MDSRDATVLSSHLCQLTLSLFLLEWISLFKNLYTVSVFSFLLFPWKGQVGLSSQLEDTGGYYLLNPIPQLFASFLGKQPIFNKILNRLSNLRKFQPLIHWIPLQLHTLLSSSGFRCHDFLLQCHRFLRLDSKALLSLLNRMDTSVVLSSSSSILLFVLFMLAWIPSTEFLNFCCCFIQFYNFFLLFKNLFHLF